jgi:hypothetical protein
VNKNVVTLDKSDDDNEKDEDKENGREVESARDDDPLDVFRSTDNNDPKEGAENSNNDAEEEIELPPGELNPCLAREMKKLGGCFNPAAASVATRATQQTADYQSHTQADSQSGRETTTNERASIMIDRRQYDLCPEFAFLHTTEVTNSEVTKEVTKTIDLDKLIEPKKYQDAYDHPEDFQREKWRSAIAKEFGDMKRQKV